LFFQQALLRINENGQVEKRLRRIVKPNPKYDPIIYETGQTNESDEEEKKVSPFFIHSQDFLKFSF
tara:strand:- start:175 stop:372 length:198 start_codon:yes stop_codon:yes gene_type:complete